MPVDFDPAELRYPGDFGGAPLQRVEAKLRKFGSGLQLPVLPGGTEPTLLFQKILEDFGLPDAARAQVHLLRDDTFARLGWDEGGSARTPILFIPLAKSAGLHHPTTIFHAAALALTTRDQDVKPENRDALAGTFLKNYLDILEKYATAHHEELRSATPAVTAATLESVDFQPDARSLGGLGL